MTWRHLAIAALLLVPALAEARPVSTRARRRNLPPPDPSAMSEAAPHSGRAPRYVPSRGLVHYMSARLAEGEGDTTVAIRELRLAAVYDQQSPFVRAELGEAYLRTGDRRHAEAAAREALDLDDHHVPALLLLGRLALETGRLEIATDWLRRAANGAPMKLEPAILLARAYLGAGDLDAARLQADRVDVIASVATDDAGVDPMRQHDAGALMDEVADALALVGRDAEAEQLYRRAAERDPTWPERLRSWAAFLTKRQRHAEAAALHGRAFALALNDPADAANAAISHLAAGDPGAAELYVAPLDRSEADPARVAASLMPVAWRLLESGRQDAAATAFEAAAEKDPTRGDTWLGAGMAREWSGNVDDALAAYDRTPRDTPQWAQAMARAADLEAKSGRAAAARTRLEAVLEVVPGAREAWLGVARNLEIAGKFVEADELRSGLLARQPHPDVAWEMAAAYVARRDDDSALRLLASIADRFDTPRLALLRIQLLDSHDRRPEALALARAFAAAHPGPAAENQLAWVLARIADLDADPSVLDEALVHARAAVAADAVDPSSRDTLGYVLLLRGDDGEAARVLGPLVPVSRDPEVLWRAGEALRRAGHAPESRDAFRRALGATTPDQAALRRRIEASLGLP